jgi:hypothetical protein
VDIPWIQVDNRAIVAIFAEVIVPTPRPPSESRSMPTRHHFDDTDMNTR